MLWSDRPPGCVFDASTAVDEKELQTLRYNGAEFWPTWHAASWCLCCCSLHERLQGHIAFCNVERCVCNPFQLEWWWLLRQGGTAVSVCSTAHASTAFWTHTLAEQCHFAYHGRCRYHTYCWQQADTAFVQLPSQGRVCTFLLSISTATLGQFVVSNPFTASAWAEASSSLEHHICSFICV